MVEKTMEVFMENFLIFGNSFENCLSRLDKMLQWCEDTNLCLNWEKSHFMVKEGIVLGHKISKNEIEVDKAKFDVIAKLPHPTTVKGVRSFLGHVGFYRRFIQDFSKISRPMTHLLEKNTPFIFSEDFIKAFQLLNKKLTKDPIFIAPNWDLPFELICDANDFAIGAVLGQRHEKHFRPIHYARKMMTDAESNYTTIEKEMLAIVYAFEKFRSYLIMNKSIVHTDHSALKYLFAKRMPRRDCSENPYENVLDPKEINETFPLETLSMVTFCGDSSTSWFVDFANYHAGNFIVKGSGTLPGNTITNPKEDLKGITTRSGVAYQGPTIPTPSKVVKQGTDVTKDQVQTPNSQSTAPVQPTVIQSESKTPVSEPVAAPVSAPMPNLKPSIPYPSRRDNERCRDQANKKIKKFYEIFKDMSFEISFTDALMLMPKFASTLKALIGNKEKLRMDECLALADLGASINLMPLSVYSANYDQMTANKIDVTNEACEEYSQEVLGLSDVTASGTPTPSDDPIISTTSHTLTPFGDSDFLLFEEADAFLGLEDDPDSPDPSPPLPNHEQFVPSLKNELKTCEAKTIKSSIDKPPEVELKDLPPHLEYAFLDGDSKLPVIIAKRVRRGGKIRSDKGFKVPQASHRLETI
nr:reverse transcriptase domain-containing protein [Tanacetum cinerariifolium]